MCSDNFDHKFDVTVANIIPTISRRDVQFMLHTHVVNIINMKPDVITSAFSTDWPYPLRNGNHFWRVPPGKPNSHRYVTYCLRPHTTRLPALSGLTPLRNLLSPASTTKLSTVSWLTTPGKILSPDSLLFGCFQLLIFTDLYKQQDQFGRPRTKTTNQLIPEVMSSRNKEICNLKRYVQLNFLN